MHAASVYIARDRLAALALRQPLPAINTGTLLLVDIAGFTPLTAAFADRFGPRAGADQLGQALNSVYTALIAAIDRYDGSIVSFSGDAMLCWFAADSWMQALVAAQDMHRALATIPISGLDPAMALRFGVKATLTAGTIQRFALGDPSIQRIDTLGGTLLTRLAELDSLTRTGETLIDAAMVATFGPRVQVVERRTNAAGNVVGLVIIDQASASPADAPAPLAQQETADAELREWILPVVWNRLASGSGDFLTELRPAVALFWRFPDLDLDDPLAELQLDRYTRWVQATVSRFAGVLLQVTLGEKGNYCYAAFGAPLAHEDDADRAVATALALAMPPDDLELNGAIRIGIASGIMRTGAYGGPTRRTYGVLGDAVNLAARLMQQALPSQIVATAAIAETTATAYGWQRQAPITVKGKSDLIAVCTLDTRTIAANTQPAVPAALTAMVGRSAELGRLKDHFALAQGGAGRIVTITGEAGIGKSRLVAALTDHVRQQGCVVVEGEAQSYGTETPFLIWQPIWRTLFAVDQVAAPEEQIAILNRQVRAIDPMMVARTPLLGPVLNLSLPDTELTRSFDPQIRNASLEALLVDCFRAIAARGATDRQPLVVVLEDMHWSDLLSRRLLAALGRVIENLTALIVVVHRPLDAAQALVSDWQAISAYPEVALSSLPSEEIANFIALRLQRQGLVAADETLAALVGPVSARTQGNPFYIDELINYIQGQGGDPRDLSLWQSSELPTTLHSLILSRIDQLADSAQQTIKVASIIGRLFRVAWLHGSYPALGDSTQVRADLTRINALDLVLPERIEPELSYLFKHVITQEVIYESLAFSTRAMLHQALASYIETSAAVPDPERVYLLAYHYEHSRHQPKTIEYLRLAGDTARSAYANDAALGYYQRLIPLIEDGSTKIEALLTLCEIMDFGGRGVETGPYLTTALRLAHARRRFDLKGRVYYISAIVHRNLGNYPKALRHIKRAVALSADPFWTAKFLQELGTVHYYLTELDQTSAVFDTINKDACDYKTLCRINTINGVVQINQSRFRQARPFFYENIKIAKRHHDLFEIASALYNIAITFFNIDAIEQSLKIDRKALELRQQIGHKPGIARSYSNMGISESRKSNFVESTRLIEKSLQISREINDKLQIVTCLITLSQIKAYQRDTALQKKYALDGFHLSEEIAYQRGIVHTGHVLAEVLYLEGSRLEARRYANKTLRIAKKIKSVDNIGYLYNSLADQELTKHNHRRAMVLVYHSIKIGLDIEGNNLVVAALTILGKIWIKQLHLQSALDTINHSLRLYKKKEMQNKQQIISILICLGTIVVTHARLDSLYRQMTRCVGLMEALVAEISHPLNEDERQTCAMISTALQAALPEPTFATLWAEGQALSISQAIEDILGWQPEWPESIPAIDETDPVISLVRQVNVADLGRA